MGTELLTVEPDFAEQVSPWVTWANALAISTLQHYSEAAEQLKAIKALTKEIEGSYGPLKQKASEAHRAIVAEEKRQLAPLVSAEATCKRAMLTYHAAEEATRLAEQRRLQAEADERARKEREKIEQAAAKQRQVEAEARAKADQARREAEQASEADRKRLLAQADAADRKAAAAAVKQDVQAEKAAAIVAPVITVASQAPKANGIATRKVWKARVVNAALVPREFLVIDEKKLDGYAKAMKGTTKVDGVEFYEENVMSARA